MENAQVINMSFINYAPGVDPEVRERYQHWVRDVYVPVGMKNAGRTGTESYQIVRESPEYPQSGSIVHYESLKALETILAFPESIAINEDRDTWNKRGIREGIWSATYELIKSFRSETGIQGGKADTRIENAPIMHIEAFRLSPEEQGKYYKWFSNFGYDFVPLFVKLAGLKGYDFFKDTGFKTLEARETKYPVYLSILYFENVNSFESYTKSHELVIFEKALRTIFPRGLKYEWYVQYQVVQRWRK
jgi:hypothetical protein